MASSTNDDESLKAKIEAMASATPGVFHPDPNYKLLNQPLGTKRSIRVITLGAGAGGVNMAYQLKKHMPDVNHIVYEKNYGVGGTWFENKYPGCACDIPSHSYQFSFAPYTEWTKYYSGTDEINAYFDWVVDKFELRDKIKLNHKVVNARWDEDDGKWYLEIESPEGIIKDWCHIFVNGSGVLNNFKWPKIPGLDSFKGIRLHSAKWDRTADLKDKRVAVIGIGSSSVQIVPAIQPIVKKLIPFIRSRVWITPGYAAKYAGPEGRNFEYTEEEKEKFKNNPEEYLEYRKALEHEVNVRFKFIIKDSPDQAHLYSISRADMMKRLAKKPEVAEKLIPGFAVGCRRPTPGNGFLEAMCEDNVDPVMSGISHITENGIIDQDGVEHEVDVIICATGFDVSFQPRFPLIGRNEIHLDEQWKDIAEAYLSIMVGNFPNYFLFLGPSAPVAHGSLLPVLELLSHFVMKFIHKLQTEPTLKAFEPKHEAIREFQIHRAAQLETTAWSSSCSSWFKNGTVDGPLVALHPGSRVHFFESIENIRWEDMNMTYNGNRFAYYGNGFTTREIEGRDLTWYLDKPNTINIPEY